MNFMYLLMSFISTTRTSDISIGNIHIVSGSTGTTILNRKYKTKPLMARSRIECFIFCIVDEHCQALIFDEEYIECIQNELCDTNSIERNNNTSICMLKTFMTSILEPLIVNTSTSRNGKELFVQKHSCKPFWCSYKKYSSKPFWCLWRKKHSGNYYPICTSTCK